MTIDSLAFTPWRSLAGGALIGLAASLLMLANGRIAGISGLLGGLLGGGIRRLRSGPSAPAATRGDFGWRLAFVLGLVAAPWAYALVARWPAMHVEASTGLLVIAGLLVGLGTRYGAGCTSGHGVCGLSRLSGRSLVATLCFMATGFLTVYLSRHAFA